LRLSNGDAALVRYERRSRLARKGAVAALHDSEASSPRLRFLRRVWQRLGRAHAKVMGGGVAFFGVLAVLPGLFALLSLYGLLADLRHVQEHADALAGLLPRQVRAAIQAELMEQVSHSAGVRGLELVGSVLVSSWSATSATEALMAAVSSVRGERETRGWLRLNLTAFLLTLTGVVFSAIAMAALFVFPSLLLRLGLARPGVETVSWLRWPLLAGVLLVGLALLYRFGSPCRSERWRWITLGSLVATFLWLSASAFFSWFVARHTSYVGLDGSIKALTVLLAWFWIAGAIVIIGAAIDAERGATLPCRSLDDA
jgi:membrane protein